MLETFEKSYILIGLSKFAQTFAVKLSKIILHSPNLHEMLGGCFSFKVKIYVVMNKNHNTVNALKIKRTIQEEDQ